jgi:hypothetical protein
MSDDKAELEALVAKLVAEELERRAKPKPPFKCDHVPFDPTANATMHPSTAAEFAKAIPSALAHDINRDARRDVHDFRPQSPEPARKPRGTGWRESTPLSPPPGVAQADRLMDEQDRRDKVELAQRLARQELASRAAKE